MVFKRSRGGPNKMPHVIEKTVFTFSELSDRAKEKARNWYREGALDYDWWDSIYEDANAIAKLIGIDLETRTFKRMNGTTGHAPNIQFSGFCSQGDGACFEGSYRYAKGALKAVKGYAPLDTELHRITQELQDAQSRCLYGLVATVRHAGRYSHEHSVSIDVETAEGASVSKVVEEQVTEALRDFCRWIYRQLEKEYEYQMADAQVDNAIITNEYTFNENGRRDF